jgi:hypothetical protein
MKYNLPVDVGVVYSSTCSQLNLGHGRKLNSLRYGSSAPFPPCYPSASQYTGS